MRIENVPSSNLNAVGAAGPEKGPQTGQPAGLPQGLERGDTFEARVVRSEENSVTLRLADGQVFEARLEGEAALLPGQTVRLTVSSLSESTVTLATQAPGDTVSLSGGMVGLPPRPDPTGSDAALRPFAEALARQGFPVTVGSVDAVRDILTQYPSLGLPKAAFLAGNGLHTDPGLLQAAVQALEGAPPVGAQLGALSAALEGAVLPFAEAQSAVPAPAGEAAPATAADTALSAPPEGVPPSWAALVEGVLGLPSQRVAPPETAALPAAAPVAAEAVMAHPHGAPAAQAEGASSPPPEVALPESAPQTALENPVARVLAQLPQLADIPASGHKLEAFGRTLEAAARELEGLLALPEGEQSAGLQSFIEKMFTRIGRDARDAPNMLQKAQEELFARLSLLEEALRQSGGPQREGVAQQTRQLMDHMRALGRIEQFTYVQLPIQQGGWAQTAELYICRNNGRGGKRIDPENVRILLALDLEHMGHVQAFVTIRGKDVSMRLDVAHQQGADFFRSQTVALHGLLSESGYRLLENRVQVQSEAIALESALETLAGYEEREFGLDVRA